MTDKIINLLPRPKQQELRYEALFRSVGIAAMLAAAVLLAGLVMQLGARVWLNHQKNVKEVQIEEIKRAIDKQENNEIKTKIRLINAQMNDFKTLADSTPEWSQVLLAFAHHVPNGVKINQFTADLATKKIVITGQSPTREMVIELYNNINQAKEEFKDINYPLENVAKPTDVTFHFTFYIQDQLINPAP